MPPSALNLQVFRDRRDHVLGRKLKAALLRELESQRHPSSEQFLNALLRAGELECAVADAGSVPLGPYMNVTDRLAERLIAPDSVTNLEAIRSLLTEAVAPDLVEFSRPEGFAYYALHPLAYADLLDAIPCLPAQLAVIGIRSIGTTLSAITAAAVRARGRQTERITVRAAGHPYNRRTRLAPEQVEFVQRHAACGAAFLVVDEGPGLSGSSFLSVAEALVDAGVPRQRMILVCSHKPDLDSLRTDDGPRRARQFQWIAVPSQPRLPSGAGVALRGGEWRRTMFADPRDWPASWISFERLKYQSSAAAGPPRLFKFGGLGHYGEQVFEREAAIAQAGFGPAPRVESHGFISYPWIIGRPMSREDLSPAALLRLAEYCAFRAEAFAQEPSSTHALQEMAQHNLQELRLTATVRLNVERPAIVDGRMQPYEWLLAQGGQMLKTDSGSHGDDHFFPGVTDIAWDLAGGIIEWQMTESEAAFFLDAYRRASGDDAAPRIADFVTAYAVFRCAYCRMAANALQGSEEEARLARAADDYHRRAGRTIPEDVLAR